MEIVKVKLGANYIRIVLIYVLFVFCSGHVKSEVYVNKFNAARMEFESGNYERAIIKYNGILEKKSSDFSYLFWRLGPVYYNLASSYFHLNRLPEALFYFQLAEVCFPRDSDLVFNLTFLKNKLNFQQVSESPFWKKYLESIKLNFIELDIIVLIFLLLSCVLFSINVVVKGSLIRKVGLVSNIIILTFGSILISKHIIGLNFGVVKENKTKVFSDISVGKKLLLELPVGAQVEILNIVDSRWVKIKLPTNTYGWVELNYIIGRFNGAIFNIATNKLNFD